MEAIMTIRALWKLSGVLAFFSVLSGCALSIHPIVSESEATFDSRLLGTWEEISGANRALVSRTTKNTYAIEYTSHGKVGRFEARLGGLGEHLVLDVWPAPRKGDLPGPYADLMIAGHLLLALDIASDEIRVATLDPDSLLDALRSGQVRMAYELSADQFILYGATKELRLALGPYLARSGALPKHETWRHARRPTATRSLAEKCLDAWHGICYSCEQ